MRAQAACLSSHLQPGSTSWRPSTHGVSLCYISAVRYDKPPCKNRLSSWYRVTGKTRSGLSGWMTASSRSPSCSASRSVSLFATPGASGWTRPRNSSANMRWINPPIPMPMNHILCRSNLNDQKYCWINYARFSPLSIFGNARGTALHDFESSARYWSKATKGHPGF